MVDRIDLGRDLGHIPKDGPEPVYTVSIHCGNIHAVFCACGPHGKNRYDLPPAWECAGQVNAVVIAVLQLRQSRANLFADLCNSSIERDRIGRRLVGEENAERRRHERRNEDDPAKEHERSHGAACCEKERGQSLCACCRHSRTAPQPVKNFRTGSLNQCCCALLPFALHLPPVCCWRGRRSRSGRKARSPRPPCTRR